MSKFDSRIIRNEADISKAFAQRRSQLRLRQSDIAELSGTGRFTVSSIEKSNPGKSVKNLLAIAEALQIDIYLSPREIVHVPLPERDKNELE